MLLIPVEVAAPKSKLPSQEPAVPSKAKAVVDVEVAADDREGIPLVPAPSWRGEQPTA